jgi:DNA processing protein
VIVAEAPERSGALITARLALEQGREVMVVPGNPWFAHTAGSNRLLREGATPVCSAADVHGVLGRPAPVAAEGIAERILAALSGEMHVGAIAEAMSVPVQELLPCLMEMELANLVEKRPGDYYKKSSGSRG